MSSVPANAAGGRLLGDARIRRAMERGSGFLVDLDGTLVSGAMLLPDAAEFMAAIAGRYVILSNNAEHTPLQLARKLRRLGLAVTPDRIVLAGTAALAMVAATSPGADILLLGSRALQDDARGRGLRVGGPTPEVVVVARDRQFSYARLAAAANAARRGARLVVCNPDRSHPGPNGDLVPETGALLGAILACTGHLPHCVVGKPEPALFHAGMEILGLTRERTTMIGDNPDTDGAGAKQLGMEFIQVRPAHTDTDASGPE
jgi:HAD superfamily hydrolase (TIGR01450 family)